MTEAELEEGRRLWDEMNVASGAYYAERRAEFIGWFRKHSDALLARREEIAREAVREFAEALRKRFHDIARRSESLDGPVSDDFCWAGLEVKELAAARGATLNEKP